MEEIDDFNDQDVLEGIEEMAKRFMNDDRFDEDPRFYPNDQEGFEHKI